MILKGLGKPRRYSPRAPERTGRHLAKVYRTEKAPNDALWLMEWESHDAFNKSGDETGEEFNGLINPAGDWEDLVSISSDAPAFEE